MTDSHFKQAKQAAINKDDGNNVQIQIGQIVFKQFIKLCHKL